MHKERLPAQLKELDKLMELLINCAADSAEDVRSSAKNCLAQSLTLDYVDASRIKALLMRKLKDENAVNKTMAALVNIQASATPTMPFNRMQSTSNSLMRTPSHSGKFAASASNLAGERRPEDILDGLSTDK